MKKFQQFKILGHTFDLQNLKANFFYTFDNEITFKENIDFGCPNFIPQKNFDKKILDKLLFHLSIALGISYYKLYPTTNIYIQSGTLNKDQISFWEQFYSKGLGEFFFKNNLKPFAPKFITTGISYPNGNDIFQISNNKALIPLGGGKDSIVSAELIKKLGISFHTCTFGKDNPLYQKVNEIIGVPRLFISRKIDPLVFKMNEEGYYNGHVPISGIIAFVLIVIAYLYDYKYIIMSNEKSANEENTEIDGMLINHQRSKSLEFEQAFNKYVCKYLSPSVKYFSLLRGMYEVKIAKIFSKFSQYFGVFSSCNRNFHIMNSGLQNSKWCCQCPKCVFVYSMLRPRITHEQTLQIFGKELYEDLNLIPLFKELLGISGIKPFECVGTNEEMILAMYNYYKQIEKQEDKPKIMEFFASTILPHMKESDFFALEKKLMKTYNENEIPEEIKQILE